MKTKILALAVFFATVFSINGVSAFADTSADILASSVVTSTTALMKSTNTSCDPVNAASIHWMCTGAIPSVRSLELMTSGCGFMVQIKCSKDTARIIGSNRSVSAIDATGIRNDVKSVEIGVNFSDIEISPTTP